MSSDAFVREAREDVRELSNGLVALERDPDRERIDELFRVAHSLKGSFGMEGFEDASALAHALEDLLDAVRGGQLEPDEETINRGLDAVDELEVMVEEIAQRSDTETEPDATIETIRTLLEDAGVEDAERAPTDEPADESAESSVEGTEIDDPDVAAALDAASEFDDLDALIDEMDDAEDDFDLDSSGSFDDIEGFSEGDEPATADDGEAAADESEPTTVDEPAADEPTAAEPATEPSTADERIDEPTAEPATEAPAADEPAAESGPGDAGTADGEPVAGDIADEIEPASADEPETADESATGAPAADEPAADEGEPEVGEPEVDEPAIDEEGEAVADDTGDESESASADDIEAFVNENMSASPDDIEGFSDVSEPASPGEPAAEPATEAPGADEPAADDPAAESEPTAEAPRADDPTDEPAAGESTTDGPADEPETADGVNPFADESEPVGPDDIEAFVSESESESTDNIEAFVSENVPASGDEPADEPTSDEPETEPAATGSLEDELVGDDLVDDVLADDAPGGEPETDEPAAESDPGDAGTGDESAEKSEPASDRERTSSAAGSDDFVWVKAEVEGGEDPTVNELQSEIEEEQFGQFEEEDTMSIQELIELSPADEDEDPDDTEGESGAEDGPQHATDLEEAIKEASTDEEPGDETSSVGPTADAAEDSGWVSAGDLSSNSETDTTAEASAEAGAADDPSPEFDADEADAEAADTADGVSGTAGDDVPKLGDIRPSDMDVGEDVELVADSGLAEFESRFEGLIDTGSEGEPPAETAATIEESSLPTDRFRDGEDEAVRETRRQPGDVQSLTVDVEYADELLSLVEELSLHSQQLTDQVRSEEALETAESLDAVTRDLQRAVMNVRLMPLERVTSGLDRVVRDVARGTDTEAELVVDGQEIQLDRSVIDKIRDPLVHLVRNAVDHGLEPRDEREAEGKPPVGTVELRARREGDDVVIEIEDDGRGIDPSDVLQSAVEEEIVTPDEARTLSRSETFDLLFHPGLSTTAEVTETSGRGVGMDVVEQTVTGLNGSVEIESEPGEGTLVRLRVPVSVALAEVVLVSAGGERLAIPADGVQRIRPADGPEIARSGLLAAQRADRTVDLADVLGRSPGVEDRVVVYVDTPEGLLGVQCDRVIDRREMVITPYDDLLADVPGVGGTTTGSNGRLIHVIDVEEL